VKSVLEPRNAQYFIDVLKDPAQSGKMSLSKLMLPNKRDIPAG
jgi:hypothetical protein